MKIFQPTLRLYFIVSCFSCAQQNTPPIQTPSKQHYSLELVAADPGILWGMAFISETEILATEKGGILYYFNQGIKQKIKGVPEVYVRGQGGLLDVALDPEYNKNHVIYLTLASSQGEDSGGNTALYRATLVENKRLEKVALLYKATPNSRKGQHWGSRIVFDRLGHLYFGIGDRGNREVNPQDLSRDGGKIYRLNLDGSIPEDNPFTHKSGAKSAIFSYGHRNPQGMATHPQTGEIWVNEHGPRGGDEINRIAAGKNYGWPIITYGINYSGTPISMKTEQEGMEQPFYYWVPSIAPSGFAILNSNKYPDWQGDFFVGSLKFEYLERLIIKNNRVVGREKIAPGVGRVRNVQQSPEGYLYLSVEGQGIYKIVPDS
ncbi:MAG: PQQ-dependent sugar dehydrogenase [Flavobacteriaceae bacterium]